MMVRRTSVTVFCGLRKVRFQCYCAQFKFNRIVLVLQLLSITFYIIIKSLVQIPFVEASLWRIQMLVRRPTLKVFCRLRKVCFECYCAQFKFNRIVLVLKLLSITFYIIVKTLAQIPFVETSICRFKKLFGRPFLTVFCALRKVRFQCYCAQFIFNRIFGFPKLLSTTFYIIVKSLVQIPFVEASLQSIQILVRMPFLTIFCGLRKVCFQCYCAQFKFNGIFLVLKLLSTTFYIIVKSLVQIPFVEAQLWRFKKLVQKPFIPIFCVLRKVRFQYYCAQFKLNRIVLVLKLLSMTFYSIVKTLAQIPFVETSIFRFKKLFRRPFLSVFCALRKVRFQCYCAQFKFNRIFLVLKLLSMTFYIIVKSFVQIRFVEASLWRIQMLVGWPFLTVFCGLGKVHFQCYCAQFKFNRIVLVLKLLSMTFYIIVKSLVQIPLVEASLWRIQMLVRTPSVTIFCGLRKVRFQCYCAQFKFNRIVIVLKLLSMTFYIIVKTFAQIPFVETSIYRFKKLFRRPFLTVFCALRKVRFQCYCAQFNFNRIVLVLKQLSITFYIIVKSLVQIPFVEASLQSIQILVRMPFLTIFCGLRKVCFQCYCAQFKFNRIFLLLKLLSTTFYTIVKTLALIPFVESSLWRFKKLVRRHFLTVFGGLRKVRFQCYCAQFKFNRIILVLKLLSMTFISSLKVSFRYLLQKPRYGGFQCWFEGLLSQFFADYAKYVSNATVLSSSSIGLFLCSNNFQ